MNTNKFNSVKVFSATMAQEREHLGEKITNWLKQNPTINIVDKIVTQSSDDSFHCPAITLFYCTESQGEDSELRVAIRQGIREGLEPLRQFTTSIENGMHAVINVAARLRRVRNTK